jgi:hypothetical protein
MEGTSVIGDVGLGIGVVVIAALFFFVLKMFLQSTTVLQKRFTELLPYTANASDGKIIIQQDINKTPDAQPILSSDNERTGIEFAYSFFLLVNENTITGDDILKTVFYKGYDNGPWPLLAPGVFIKGDTNTMRIVYNSSINPYNFVDIENIPINKYFHVVLNFRANALEVHINGKIVKKLLFENSIPYSNYSNLVIFNNFNDVTITRPPYGNIRFKDAINGQISNLVYVRYSLSYGEIQNLLSKGPSDVIKQTSKDVPPYLADSWWSNQ